MNNESKPRVCNSVICKVCGVPMQYYFCETTRFNEGRHMAEKITYKCPKCGRRTVSRRVLRLK